MAFKWKNLFHEIQQNKNRKLKNKEQKIKKQNQKILTDLYLGKSLIGGYKTFQFKFNSLSPLPCSLTPPNCLTLIRDVKIIKLIDNIIMIDHI